MVRVGDHGDLHDDGLLAIGYLRGRTVDIETFSFFFSSSFYDKSHGRGHNDISRLSLSFGDTIRIAYTPKTEFRGDRIPVRYSVTLLVAYGKTVRKNGCRTRLMVQNRVRFSRVSSLARVSNHDRFFLILHDVLEFARTWK